MTTKLATAKEWANLGGALCTTATSMVLIAHPAWTSATSWPAAISVAVGSMSLMALGVVKGGASARRLAEQYSEKGAKIWEDFETRLGSHAATFGRSTIFTSMTFGFAAALGLERLMDNGLPIDAGIVCGLGAAALVTAAEGVKQGIWDRMNRSTRISSGDDAGTPDEPGAPRARAPGA